MSSRTLVQSVTAVMGRHVRSFPSPSIRTLPSASRLASTSSSSSSSQPSSSSSSSSSSTPPATTPAGKSKVNPDAYTVPPLSRPLGVTIPPRAESKSWAQRKDEMLDPERHKANRRALVKEATQGYFHDYNLARKANGGKLWTAPPVLIREDRALYFPNISGKSLLSSTTHTTSLLSSHISLVSIVNTRVSDEHVQSFVDPVLEDWEGSEGFRYVQINHQANTLKSMLLNFFVASLKRSVPEDRWGSYLISSGEWSEIDITGPLGIDNKLLGYVFLVDENVRVRWAGCGAAQGSEAEDLRRAAAVLMRRMQGRQQTDGTGGTLSEASEISAVDEGKTATSG